MDDKVKKYKIDSVWNYQIEIKERSGQHVGIPKILRVEDLENGLIIISKNGRSQLDNKERIFELLNAKQQNLALKQKLKLAVEALNWLEELLRENYNDEEEQIICVAFAYEKINESLTKIGDVD